MRFDSFSLFLYFSWLTFRWLILLFFLMNSLYISTHNSWSLFIHSAKLILIRLMNRITNSARLFRVKIRTTWRMISLYLLFFLNNLWIKWSFSNLIILTIFYDIKINILLRRKFKTSSLFRILFLLIKL